MLDIYKPESAYKALQKEIRHKPACSMKDFADCLALLRNKQEIKSQIRALEKQVADIQREVELSSMYILHGTEYCQLLSVLHEWGEKHDVDAL